MGNHAVQAAVFFPKFINMLLGYFDPVNITLYNKSKQLLG